MIKKLWDSSGLIGAFLVDAFGVISLRYEVSALPLHH